MRDFEYSYDEMVKWFTYLVTNMIFYSDNYNPVPGVMDGVPSSRDYHGGFASKLMVGHYINHCIFTFPILKYLFLFSFHELCKYKYKLVDISLAT